MDKYLKSLRNVALFQGLNDLEYNSVLDGFCFVKNYSSNEVMFSQGDYIKVIGIVVRGEVQLEKYDFNGNRSIYTKLSIGDLFGISFVCSNNKLPFSIICSSDCDIVYLNYEKIKSYEHLYIKLLENILFIMSHKSIMFNKKLDYLSKKTIREKVLLFLSDEALANKNSTFKIAYNREELADYLGIDRSAMCFVLSKLKKEGIIGFKKNIFNFN